MEIKGLGSTYIPITREKAVSSKDPDFKRVLYNLVNNKKTKHYANENKKETQSVNGLLSFLKKASINELVSEQQGVNPNLQTAKSDGLQSIKNLPGINGQKYLEIMAQFVTGQQVSDHENLPNSDSDRLQDVKNLLGISDSKWSEIISELEVNAKEKLKDNDPINILIDGLSSIAMNLSKTDFTENKILFIKAAKVYSLLSNQKLSGQQFITGLLDTLKEQLEGIIQNGQAKSKSTYLQNTFSQLVSELNVENEITNQTSRQNAINRLTDWNAGSPFLQQMAKPEQLSIMEGTAKSVSVDDLIQQFESILSKSQFSKLGGVQKLFIKLNPEHLGSINIELIRKDQVLTARILTTTEAAKEALESHLHNLKHAFEAQSIKVDNVEIGQQPSQSQQDDFFNRGQSGRQDYPEDQESEPDDQEQSDSSFILTLEEAILNQEV